MSINTQDINITHIAASVAIPLLKDTPGKSIIAKAAKYCNDEDSLNLDKKTSSIKQKLFEKFLEKIPEVKKSLTQLAQKCHITAVHLCLPINFIFLNFIDELIEHYQNQIETKDENLNLTWLNFRRSLLKKTENHWWTEDFKEFKAFLFEIKDKLADECALPDDFDDIISLWENILKVQFFGKTVLASLFEESANSKTRVNLAEPSVAHSTKISLNQSDVLQSFFLLVKQVQKNYSWMLDEILEKFQPLDNLSLGAVLDEFVRGVVCEIEPSQKSKPVSELVQIYVQRVKEEIEIFALANPSNRDSIALVMKRIADKGKNKISAFSSDSIRFFVFIKSGKREDSAASIKDDIFINCEVIGRLQAHLDSFISLLHTLLQGIGMVHVDWYKYEKNKIFPKLASDLLPLLPAPFDPKANNNLIDGLLKDDSENKDSVKTKTQKKPAQDKKIIPGNNNSKRRKNTKKKKGADKTSITPSIIKTTVPISNKKSENLPVLSIILTPIASMDKTPILNFKAQLRDLYRQNPFSDVLRQTLWHLDPLITLQRSLPESPTAAESLTLTNAVAYYAHKVIEQTYRFCIEGNSGPLTTKTHDLKAHYRQLNPDFKNYPAVVSELFLANNWCRYFYFDHDHWRQITTGIAKKPPRILDSLVEMADGHIPEKQDDLKNLINSTVENMYQHIKSLLKLKDEEISESQSRDTSYTCLKLETFFPDTLFDKIAQTLKDFLNSSKYSFHHPVYLSIKQALAALTMLKESVKKINEAKDVQSFSTWVIWSLQQLQESVENILHAIAYCENAQVDTQHEIETLATQVGLGMEIGSLGPQFRHLSHVVRYPVENKGIGTIPESIIGHIELLKENSVDVTEKFNLGPAAFNNIMLWTKDLNAKKADPNFIVSELGSLMTSSQEFLEQKALPELKKKMSYKSQ
jgi:hypothetical protein